MLVEEKKELKKNKVSELKKIVAPICANTDIWQSVEF